MISCVFSENPPSYTGKFQFLLSCYWGPLQLTFYATPHPHSGLDLTGHKYSHLNPTSVRKVPFSTWQILCGPHLTQGKCVPLSYCLSCHFKQIIKFFYHYTFQMCFRLTSVAGKTWGYTGSLASGSHENLLIWFKVRKRNATALKQLLPV